MRRQLKIFVPIVIAVVLLALLHFVPVDSRSGYIYARNGGCLDAPYPLDYNYRWIKGQVNDWDNQINYIRNKDNGCGAFGHIRLYIL